MFKPRKLKPIQIGYGDEKIAFYPATFSQAAQDEVERQLAEAEAETLNKHQLKFDIKVQAIAEWSDEMPKEITTVKGEPQLSPIVKDQTNITDAMKTFFEKRTVENERAIDTLYRTFVNLQNPEIDFL